MKLKFGNALTKYGKQLRTKKRRSRHEPIVHLTRIQAILAGLGLVAFVGVEVLLGCIYKKYM